MHTTHTSKSSRRFNRHNLPPNHAAALVILNDDMEIKCIVASALRITSSSVDVEKFDQMFVAQTTAEAAILESRPVTADSHRTTVVFEDTECTRKIGRLDSGCWAQISIRGRAPNQLRPEIVWTPLDENTWLPTREMATKFPLPLLGECWPLAPRCTEFSAKNPVAWHLATKAAVLIGGMTFDSFPSVAPEAAPADLNWLMVREEKIRTARQQVKVERMLEKLPDDLRKQYLAQLAARAK